MRRATSLGTCCAAALVLVAVGRAVAGSTEPATTRASGDASAWLARSWELMRPPEAAVLRKRHAGELARCLAVAGDVRRLEEVLATPDIGGPTGQIDEATRALRRCECFARAGDAAGAARNADLAINGSADGEAREQMRGNVVAAFASAGRIAEAQVRAAQITDANAQLSAWLSIAWHARRTNDSDAYASAMTAAERAAKQIAKSDARAGDDAMLRVATRRISNGELDVARRMLGELPPPARSHIHVQLAEAAIERSDRAGCMKELDAALAADPSLSPQLARLAARVGHERIIQRATTIAEQSYKSGLGRDYVIVWVAGGYTGPDADAKARRMLDLWEAGQANREQARFARSAISQMVGLEFLRQGNADGAIALMEDVPIASRSPAAQSVIVLAHAEAWRAAEAIAAYKQLEQIRSALRRAKPPVMGGLDLMHAVQARRWLVGGLIKSRKIR